MAAGAPSDNSFFLVNIQLLLGDLGEKSHLKPARDISMGISSGPNFEACFGNHLKNWEVEWTETLRCGASRKFQKDGELPSHASVYCSAVVRKKVLVVFQGCDYAMDS